MKSTYLFFVLCVVISVVNKQVKSQTNRDVNVALHGNTSQSTTYRACGSDKAVDGNTDGNLDHGHCSHTDEGDPSPWFQVTFPQSNIKYIHIYNRDSNKDRLQGFTLQLSDEENNIINSYKDQEANPQDVYTINYASGVIATKAKITQSNKIPGDSVAFVTICEIEIFGELNLALHRPTSQSSTYQNHGSDLAVDGNTDGTFTDGRCTHTGERDSHPWFQVTFPKSYINMIQIYNRGDRQERLKGFKLNLYEGAKEICTYVDTASNSQHIYTVSFTPSKTATNINITQSNIDYNDRVPFLTICEIQIFGNIIECSAGFYGIYCLEQCSSYCSTTTCDRQTGSCTCKPGYTGLKCDQECPSGTYGDNCRNSCSSHCTPLSPKCNKETGFCKCNPGYNGSTCEKECLEGTYGYYCMHQCYKGCTSRCNNTNGYCTCKPGYIGDTCDKECNPGKWGPLCLNNCSEQCSNTSCDGETGSCMYGCKEGFTLPNCTEPCDRFHFGRNCSFQCSSNCTNGTCNSKDGSCDQCYPGYQGNYCNQDCNDTYYGQNCISVCNSQCLNQRCHHVTGKCLDCPNGTFGDRCEKCPTGLFGYGCSENCSANCNPSNECNATNGNCDNGCIDGFTGYTCDTECPNNTYGQACANVCSIHCPGEKTDDTRLCDHRNGSCFGECLVGYIGPTCSEALTASQDPPVGVIVGVVISVIVIVLVILSGVLFWRRRHPLKKNELDRETRTIPTELPERLSLQTKTTKETSVDDDEYKPEKAYYNTSSELDVNMAIKVSELNNYMKKHDKQFFLEQFKKIPQAQNVTTETALSDENKNKNRYKNICPYDHSRVNLLINKERKEGDYINASYIQDNKNKVKFIASQGPNTKMIDDFIRMLWEQKTEVVVMLTNLIEEGKVKCERYWPENGKTNFGEIEVKLLKTQTFADYTIRGMELSKPDDESRKFTHFHFTSWPDQSTPTTPWAMVDFAQKVFAKTSTSPIVVHCSAGVGRTGTFIALHNVLQQAEETGQVDFYNTLVKLRKDRIFMIQTGDQYAFLHRAAQVAILCNNTYMELKDISDKIKHLKQTTEVSKLTNMEKEFQSMKDVSDAMRQSQNDETGEVTKEQVYQNSFQLKQDVKNRFLSIVPRNCDRPYLTTYDKEMSDYINAVFVQGFHKKDHHILTQLPMPATVTDLWRLVTQYKISIMVAFETDTIIKDQTMAWYLPTVKEVTLSSDYFEVKCMSHQHDELWEEQTLKVRSEKAKSDSQDVVHLKCKLANLESKYLLRLVKKIKSYNLHANGKIVYLCRDGATYSGLCCVLSNLLDRLDSDSSLSVPLVVGALKTIRPEVIPDMEQYRTVYEVLEKYSEISTPYSNVDENYFPKRALKPVINKPKPSVPTTDENVNVYNNV